jgi:Ala-tRNA(Pro) deacylase
MLTMPGRIEDLLRRRHAPYRTLRHAEVFTSQEVAHANHISGRKIAKVVALRDDAGAAWVLAVVPAPMRVDLEALRFWLGRPALRLASEAEMAQRFPDCEPGAVPPFAPLHDIPIVLEDSFAETSHIYFEDGSHRRLVGMRLQDYVRIAEPIIRRFATRPSAGH